MHSLVVIHKAAQLLRCVMVAVLPAKSFRTSCTCDQRLAASISVHPISTNWTSMMSIYMAYTSDETGNHCPVTRCYDPVT